MESVILLLDFCTHVYVRIEIGILDQIKFETIHFLCCFFHETRPTYMMNWSVG